MQEYFDWGHAELVPSTDMDKAPLKVFYLPMHAVYKESSTTTKVRVIFDASAKTSTGVLLNDTLLVGPTVHPSLIDVLSSLDLIVLLSQLTSVRCIGQSSLLRRTKIFIILSGGHHLKTQLKIIE